MPMTKTAVDSFFRQQNQAEEEEHVKKGVRCVWMTGNLESSPTTTTKTT